MVNHSNRNATMELQVNSAATIVMPCFGIQYNIFHTSLMLGEIDFNSLAAFTCNRTLSFQFIISDLLVLVNKSYIKGNSKPRLYSTVILVGIR